MADRHDESKIPPASPAGAKATGGAPSVGAADAKATGGGPSVGAADAKATGGAPSVGAADAKATGGAGGSMSPQTASLLGLIDRLGSLLERSDLVELEVESGQTGIVLRKPAALAPATTVTVAAGEAASSGAAAAPADPAPVVSTARTVKAPLTGIFYSASSPSSPPYVIPGQRIEVGTVIGLIEAMKLFNEIKSDQAGRVVRVVAETGKLVKAKQPLVEVEP